MTKAIILAAGKSLRTYPLTLTMPKPLLKIANKPILQHNLEQISGLVSEILIVVGYKKEMVKKYIRKVNYGVKVKLLEQKSQKGTGNALFTAKKYIKDTEDFLVLMGDDLYNKQDIKKLLGKKYAILTKKVKNPSKFGVCIIKGNLLKKIEEKPRTSSSKFVNCGAYHLDNKIFELLRTIIKSKRGEYELTDAVGKLAKMYNVYTAKANFWIPIGFPWDLLIADKILRNGNSIGKNTIINGKILNSSIGDNCVIEGDIYDSIVMDNVWIKKGSFVKKSIIANNVEFSGIINPKKKLKIEINKNHFIVENFGAVIGENAIIDNVNIKAGSLIRPHQKLKTI